MVGGAGPDASAPRPGQRRGHGPTAQPARRPRRAVPGRRLGRRVGAGRCVPRRGDGDAGGQCCARPRRLRHGTPRTRSGRGGRRPCTRQAPRHACRRRLERRRLCRQLTEQRRSASPDERRRSEARRRRATGAGRPRARRGRRGPPVPRRTTARRPRRSPDDGAAAREPAAPVPRSGGQARAALAPARGEDRAAGASPHPQPEAVRLGAPAVVRLERALAHSGAPGGETAMSPATRRRERSSGGAQRLGPARRHLTRARLTARDTRCRRTRASTVRAPGGGVKRADRRWAPASAAPATPGRPRRLTAPIGEAQRRRVGRARVRRTSRPGRRPASASSHTLRHHDRS